jgi:hypothetical protein
MERKISFLFGLVLLMIAAIPCFSRECPDPAYKPGAVVTLLSGASLCGTALKIGVPCELLRQALLKAGTITEKFDPNAKAGGLTFKVPTDKEFQAIRDSLPDKLKTNAAAKKPAASKAVARKASNRRPYCSEELNRESIKTETRPFVRENYLRCTYLVTSADETNKKTLAQLARDFNSPAIRFVWFNDMKADQLLVANSMIEIPDWDFTYWCFINRSAFGNRDLNKLWPMLRIFKEHPELINVLNGKILNNDYKVSTVQSGERFVQWSSGNYRVLDNGVAAFSADTFVTARRFDIPIPGEDSILVLKLIDVCNNTVYRKIQKEPEPSTPPTAVSPPPCPPADTVIKSTTPDTSVKTTTTWVTENSPASAKTALLLRADLLASDRRPTWGPLRQGSQCYGGRLDLLFNNNNSRHSFGFTIMANGYDGEAQSRFRYWGFKGCVGPMLILSLSPAVYWGSDLEIGAMWDWVNGNSGYRYHSFQTNGFGRLGQTFDAQWSWGHLSIWAGFELAFSAAKDSRVDNVPFTLEQDPPTDKSGFDGGVRLFFGKSSATVKPLLVYRGAHTRADHSNTNEVGTGLSFWQELLTIEVSFVNRSNSFYPDANGNAIGTTVTFSFGEGRGKAASQKKIEERLSTW